MGWVWLRPRRASSVASGIASLRFRCPFLRLIAHTKAPYKLDECLWMEAVLAGLLQNGVHTPVYSTPAPRSHVAASPHLLTSTGTTCLPVDQVAGS